MGDLTDSLFQRQCPLHEPEAREWLGKGGGEITVLEIGGQRRFDTHHISSPQELRQYVDLQNHSDDTVDSCWHESQHLEPRSLKLFFLKSRDHERGNFSPKTAQLPDLVNVLHTSTGSSTASDTNDDDDDPISPSSSPQRSALLAHSRNPRFPLSPVHEDRIAKSQLHQASDQFSNRWTWETRYIRSTTLTVAESNSTAYFCMDFPEKLRKRIAKTIHSLEALAKSPLFMDTLIIDEIINFYRDAIKVHRTQMLAVNEDDNNSTETSIKLEELATHWRTILRDIHNIQTHIHHLQEIAASRAAQQRKATMMTASPHKSNNPYQHTRQKSSEVLGPQSAEIFKLQHSTCEFWARCVNMYLERTTDRIRNSTYRLTKTIPLRRRGSLPQLNRRLSNFTIEVAVHFQRNSNSVSTFALSFLSTVFFSPDGLLLAITHWWWIFVTLIVPLTFIIIHLWFETLANNTAFLRRRKMERRQREQQHQQQHQQQLDGLEEEDMD
ncbi:hypothetical protein N0V93_004897 [Gnomoniopsis smithogilvyi]|uniref:Uncharacterized protein n=1 Tax=Gnomoniopsis smithogilvyi TaxID=1191159 RepID=A0A9W9CXI5_9PEZI|nr:hypothetical protein N0V93_004897 [Gnomoniopsis smithogilvyi]